VKRHELYIKALKTTGVETYLGYFKKVYKNVQINKRLQIQLATHEEKQTDVNIGIEMIRSGYKDEFDIALLISGDTDFHPIVRMLKTEFKNKKIWVVVPNKAIVKPLDKIADRCSTINEKHLADSQFPEKITLGSGREITKPSTWNKRV